MFPSIPGKPRLSFCTTSWETFAAFNILKKSSSKHAMIFAYNLIWASLEVDSLRQRYSFRVIGGKHSDCRQCFREPKYTKPTWRTLLLVKQLHTLQPYQESVRATHTNLVLHILSRITNKIQIGFLPRSQHDLSSVYDWATSLGIEANSVWRNKYAWRETSMLCLHA